MHNKPAGNILIPAATVITGGTYESTKQFANALNLNFVNKDQFYDVQDKIVFPVIDSAEFHHTGNLEVYHSLLLKYAPKRQHFSYKGMVARTQLAVIDHNCNTGRRQATVINGTKQGEKRYKVVFPKGRKKWVVKPVLERKSFAFVQQLMEGVLLFKDDKSQQTSTIPGSIPKNIAPTPRPSKDEVVAAHMSRMGKK